MYICFKSIGNQVYYIILKSCNQDIDFTIFDIYTLTFNLSLSFLLQNPAVGSRLCCSVLKAYGHLLHQSSVAQDAFEQRVGYERLRKLLSSVATPTEDILKEILNIVSVYYIPITHNVYLIIHVLYMYNVLCLYIHVHVNIVQQFLFTCIGMFIYTQIPFQTKLDMFCLGRNFTCT